MIKLIPEKDTDDQNGKHDQRKDIQQGTLVLYLVFLPRLLFFQNAAIHFSEFKVSLLPAQFILPLSASFFNKEVQN